MYRVRINARRRRNDSIPCAQNNLSYQGAPNEEKDLYKHSLSAPIDVKLMQRFGRAGEGCENMSLTDSTLRLTSTPGTTTACQVGLPGKAKSPNSHLVGVSPQKICCDRKS